MKRGPTPFEFETDAKNASPLITKTLNELLGEIAQGQYDDFRAYLEENKVNDLDFDSKLPVSLKDNLGQLSRALQGTRVHTVNLERNQIGAAGARDFAVNLKGTQVHTVDLSRNQIGAAGARDFAAKLEGTQVHTVDLRWNQVGAAGARDFAVNLKGTQVCDVDLSGNQIGDAGAREFVVNLKGTQVHMVKLDWNQIIDTEAKDFGRLVPQTLLTEVIGLSSAELKDALSLNQRLSMSPYYWSALRLLPEKTKEDELAKNLDFPQSKEDEIQFAGRILMNLPLELFSYCLSYLPIMQGRDAQKHSAKLLEISRKHHPKGLEQQESIEMEVEPSDNSRRIIS